MALTKLTNRGAIKSEVRFDSVLQAKEAKYLSRYLEGTKIRWEGYYSQSDGGSNWGILRFGTHTEDGGHIFSIDTNTYIEANLKGGVVNVVKFGADPTGASECSDRLISAIRYCGYDIFPTDNPKLVAIGKFKINKTIDISYLRSFYIDFLVRDSVFTGDHMAVCVKSTTACKESVIVLDGLDRTVHGLLISDPTNAQHTYTVYGQNLDTLVVVSGNTEKSLITAHAYRCVTIVHQTSGNGQTADENTFYIFGSGVDTAYKQDTFTTAQVFLNVEATGFYSNAYAVEISSGKHVTLSGFLRVCQKGGVLVNGSSPAITFNNLGIYGCYVNYAVDIIEARNINGSVITDQSSAGAIRVLSTVTGDLNISIPNAVIPPDTPCIKMGDDNSLLRRFYLKANLGSVTGESYIADMSRVLNCKLDLDTMSSNTNSLGVNLGSLSSSQLTIPYNNPMMPINRDSLSYVPIYITGAASSEEIADISAVRGMMIFDRTLGIQRTYDGNRWTTNGLYRSSAPTSGTWVKGDTAGNLTPTAGGNAGWICVESSPQLNLNPWVKGEDYSVGDKVVSGSSIYVCASGGVSGSTEPTGTDEGISDGGCTWDYSVATSNGVWKGYGSIES